MRLTREQIKTLGSLAARSGTGQLKVAASGEPEEERPLRVVYPDWEGRTVDKCVSRDGRVSEQLAGSADREQHFS